MWLTAAKSAWLFYRATFQKPRVFCCTGYYQLSKVSANIKSEGNLSGKLGVSPAVVGAASGIPVGGTIGPFSNGQSLAANVTMAEPAIWAARFHQLKVEYLQIAEGTKTELSPNIMLKPDCTHPRGGLMGDEPAVSETKVVEEPDKIKYAQGVVTTSWTEAEEIGDDEELDGKYWEAFETSVSRLQDDDDADD